MVDKRSHSDEQLATWLQGLPDPPIRGEFEREFVSKVASRLRSEQPPSVPRDIVSSRIRRSPLVWSSVAAAAVIVGLMGARSQLNHLFSPIVATAGLPHVGRGSTLNDSAGATGHSIGRHGSTGADGSGNLNDSLTAMNTTTIQSPQAPPHSSGEQKSGKYPSSTLGESNASGNTNTPYTGTLGKSQGSATTSEGDQSKNVSDSGSQVPAKEGREGSQGSSSSVNSGLGSRTTPGAGTQSSSGTGGQSSHGQTGKGDGGGYVAAVSTRTGLLDTTTQTEDAFFLAGYGWHTAGLGTASIVNLPTAPTDRKSDLYPYDLYFTVASLLSSDVGLTLNGWFGTAVEIDRLPLVETSPFEKDQLAYAIVVRAHDRIVGSWIDLPRSETVGISLRGNSVKYLDQGRFTSWLARQTTVSGEDQPTEQKIDAGEDSKATFTLLAAYAQAVNSADLTTVRSLLSPDLMLRRMLDDRAQITGFSLGSVTTWEQSVQSIAVSSMVPIAGAPSLTSDEAGDVPAASRLFAVTADVTYRNHPDAGPNRKVLWITLVQSVRGAPWRIGNITMTP